MIPSELDGLAIDDGAEDLPILDGLLTCTMDVVFG